MALIISLSEMQGNSYDCFFGCEHAYTSLQCVAHTSTPLSIINPLNPRTPASTIGLNSFYKITKKVIVITINVYTPHDIHPHTYLISRYNSTPKPNIDPALPTRNISFSFQILDARCRWYRIERHVDECCYTTGCGCECTCCEPFPGGTAGVV